MMHELLQHAALMRQRSHVGHASTRRLNSGHDHIGVAGEYAFARDFHQRLDLSNRPGGDGGVDFWLPLMFSVDVKSSPTPGHLLVEVGKVTADIYVLARADSADMLGGKCLGWEWADNVLKAPQRNFNNGGIINHCIPASLLRPMAELRRRLAVIGFAVDGA